MSDDLNDMFSNLPANKTTPEDKPSGKKKKKAVSSPAEATKQPKKKKAAAPAEEQAPQKKVLDFVDSRNLTKQGKASVITQWEVANRKDTRQNLMTSLMLAAQEKFGSSSVFGTRDKLDQLVIGIPIPSLPFEFVIANDVFPLQVLIMLAGTWGSCKSALSYEIFRWFYENTGIVVHIDSEDKFDAEFACSIMRTENGHLPIISNQATSLEQAQQLITYYIETLKAQLIGSKENPGPGARVPCCICLDSVAGSSSQQTQKKILEEGFAGKSYPVEALSYSKYLPTIKSTFTNFPFTLLMINHQKEKTDDMGNKLSYTLGGGALNFHESFELSNSVWKSQFRNSQFEGIGVKIKCTKNSFGPTHRQIKTRFIWWQDKDPDTGETVQRHLWDWNWAICELLNSPSDYYKKRLKQHDLVIKCKAPTADIECMANFPAIGMGKNEYLPFQEVGELIHQDEEVCDRIREALIIKRRYVLDKPYDDIVKEHDAKAEKSNGKSKSTKSAD
jgi:RecA/RadA recombinase